MAENETKDPLGEEPLFTDENGNTFFPQEESDHTIRRRIKEEQYQAKRKQAAYIPPLTKEMALAAKVALDRQSSPKIAKINERRLGDQALDNAMGGQGWNKGRH